VNIPYKFQNLFYQAQLDHLSMKKLTTLILTSLLAQTALSEARGARPEELGASSLPIGAEGVVWYSTWDTALAEAKRSNRPIFFMAAAHQCGTISGTF